MSHTLASHPSDIVDALHDLTRELQKLDAQPRAIAENVREVIARSGLGRLSLVDYLLSRGFDGVRLARASGTFGKACAEAYRARYGVNLETVHDEKGWIVNLYLELDRPLIDEVFAEWSR